MFLEILFNSIFFVALTEMGDKTQLLAFILATRYKKPWTIMGAIFLATIANHLLAAWLGTFISQYVPAHILKWSLVAVFLAFAIWVMIPDKEGEVKSTGKWGAFLTTFVSFFLAEMGDKTQLTTLALAAKYNDLTLVTIGSTIGMMISSALAIFFGNKLTKRIPMKVIHAFAAFFFVIMAIGIIVKF